MKKIFLLFLLFAATHSLFAQSVKFGLSAGLNESTNSTYQGSPTVISGYKGFNAGVFAEFDQKKFSFEPGLFFSVKGYNAKTYIQYTDNASVNAQGKVVLNYLELPLNVLYNIRVPIGKLFIGGGPYFAYAISGHSNSTVNQNGTTFTQSSNSLFNSGSPFKRTDFGLNAVAGLSLKNGILFNLKYGYGLTSIFHSTQTSTDGGHNSVFSVSAGYMFL